MRPRAVGGATCVTPSCLPYQARVPPHTLFRAPPPRPASLPPHCTSDLSLVGQGAQHHTPPTFS